MRGISIEERAVALAQYIIDSKDTVRGAAKRFGVSKSTVHKDVSERLIHINQVLATDVRKVLDENKAERHIRGGMATKLKYEREKMFFSTHGYYECVCYACIFANLSKVQRLWSNKYRWKDCRIWFRLCYWRVYSLWSRYF